MYNDMILLCMKCHFHTIYVCILHLFWDVLKLIFFLLSAFEFPEEFLSRFFFDKVNLSPPHVRGGLLDKIFTLVSFLLK